MSWFRSLKWFTGLILLAVSGGGLHAAELECVSWQQNHPSWIWCDDFEDDARLAQDYFEVDRAGGRFGVAQDTAFGGTGALRATYMPGSPNAGGVKISFGRTPVSPQLLPSEDFGEIYWRVYMTVGDGWMGNGSKTSRALIFAGNNWSEAAISHVWDDGLQGQSLGLDPVSGVSGGSVVTTKYNDFANFKWLGRKNAQTRIYAPENAGRWFCVEASMKLNTPGQSDGTARLWIDGTLEANATNLDWRGTYTGYGINALFLENYVNGGPSQVQNRYMDNFVISRERIGCAGSATVRPGPPTNLRVQ